MSKQPTVKTRNAASLRGRAAGEKIVEVSWPDGSGCLISLRMYQDTPCLEIYRDDEKIHILADVGAQVRAAVRREAREIGISPADVRVSYESSPGGENWEWCAVYPATTEPVLKAYSEDLDNALRQLGGKIREHLWKMAP